MTSARLIRIFSRMPIGMGFGLFDVRSPLATMPDAKPRSDVEALRGDWIKIGQDFRVAAQKLQSEHARSR